MKDEGPHVGQRAESSQRVTEELSAGHVGSGTLRVYATPAMALFVEQVCRAMVDPDLPEGQVTVGVALNLRHLAPTPVGGMIHVTAEITAVEENLIDFSVEVRDDAEAVGEATHRRAVIEESRFLRRVREKIEALGL